MRCWRDPLAAFLVLAVGMFAVGCGTLNVRVWTLDPKVIEAEQDRRLVRESLPIVLAQTPKAFEKEISDLQQAHYNAWVVMGQPYLDAANATSDAVDKEELNEKAKSMQDIFARQVVPFYDDVRSRGRALSSQIRDLFDESESASGEDRRRLIARYTAELRKRERLISDLFAIVKSDLDGRMAEEIKKLKDAASSGLVTASSAATALEEVKGAELAGRVSKSLIADQGIVDSPFAHAVASAPASAWKPFNKVYGTARFGNVNVAIKMVDLGDFTLKGLSFDPSDIARTAAKVTTQAVLLSAQIAGAPVSVSRPAEGDGAALATSSSRIAQSRMKILEAKTRMKSFQDALDTIAGSILDASADLDDPAQGRRAEAIAAVKATFDAHKGRLAGN